MNEQSFLEKLKRRMYRKSGEDLFERRSERVRFSPSRERNDSWKEESAAGPKKKLNFSRLVAALLILAVLAAAALFFLFWRGGFNLISSGNIEITIEGPVSVKGGETANWQAGILNENRSALESAALIIEYPEFSKPLKRFLASPLKERIPLGTVKPGQTVSTTFGAVIFGQEGTDKEFKITLEYRPEGSNAIFAKTKKHVVRISSSPLSLSLSGPSESGSGQEAEIKINLLSNSEEPISSLLLRVEYPFGFSFKSASFEPIEGESVWRIGDLLPGSQREIAIRGILEGQDEEVKYFRASAGILGEEGDFIVYGSGSASLTVRKSFLETKILVGRGEETIVSLGQRVDVSLVFKNNLPVAVSNVMIEAKAKGRAINTGSFYINNGFLRSDNTIVWNASTFKDLSVLDPGESGTLRFNFSLSEDVSSLLISSDKPEIHLEARIFVLSPPAGFERENIEGRGEKTLRIASRLQLASRALYFTGIFENSGPLPPKAGEETSYTLVWSLTNSLNDLTDVLVRASLPPYMKWAGEFLSSSENVSYNSATGEVLWKIGEIKAGTGFNQPAREVSFKVILVPAANQTGKMVVLLSEATAEAKDVFTNLNLTSRQPEITTELKTDPGFKFGQEKVIQ